VMVKTTIPENENTATRYRDIRRYRDINRRYRYIRRYRNSYRDINRRYRDMKGEERMPAG
jgi:hypothetical protein